MNAAISAIIITLFLPLNAAFAAGKIVHLLDRLNKDQGTIELKLKSLHHNDLACDIYLPITVIDDLGNYIERFTVETKQTLKAGQLLEVSVDSDELKAAIGKNYDVSLLIDGITDQCQEANVVVYQQWGNELSRPHDSRTGSWLHHDGKYFYTLTRAGYGAFVLRKLDKNGKQIWSRKIVTERITGPGMNSVLHAIDDRVQHTNHKSHGLFTDDGERLWFLFLDKKKISRKFSQPYCILRGLNKKTNAMDREFNLCDLNPKFAQAKRNSTGNRPGEALFASFALSNKELIYVVSTPALDEMKRYQSQRFIRNLNSSKTHYKNQVLFVPLELHFLRLNTETGMITEESFYDPKFRIIRPRENIDSSGAGKSRYIFSQVKMWPVTEKNNVTLEILTAPEPKDDMDWMKNYLEIKTNSRIPGVRIHSRKELTGNQTTHRRIIFSKQDGSFKTETLSEGRLLPKDALPILGTTSFFTSDNRQGITLYDVDGKAKNIATKLGDFGFRNIYAFHSKELEKTLFIINANKKFPGERYPNSFLMVASYDEGEGLKIGRFPVDALAAKKEVNSSNHGYGDNFSLSKGYLNLTVPWIKDEKIRGQKTPIFDSFIRVPLNLIEKSVKDIP